MEELNILLEQKLEQLDRILDNPLKLMLQGEVLDYRVELARQYIEKNRKLPIEARQSINCIAMEEISVEACPVEVSCKTLFRSCEIIPTPIFHHKFAKLSTPFLDSGQQTINWIEDNQVEYISERKWTANDPFGFFDGGRIYVLNSRTPVLKLRSMFSNPIQVIEYKEQFCGEEDNWDLEKIFKTGIRAFIDKWRPLKDGTTEISINGENNPQ